DPAECGTSPVRVVAGAPARAHIYRSVQLLAASAAERLWITDAYLLAPPPLYAALLDAAKAGGDVRLLVPGASRLPVPRNLTRAGGPAGAGTRRGPQAFRIRDGRGGGGRLAPRGRRAAPGDRVDRGAHLRRRRRAAAGVPACDEHHARRRCVLARLELRTVRDA